MASREGKFKVRQANSFDDHQWIQEATTEEDHFRLAKDAECLFSINFTRYFFVGELNGERISCIAIIKYSEELAYVGWYAVIEPHRGKGYGYRTWKYAFEASSIGEQSNVSLYCAVEVEKIYSKSGFKRVCVTHLHVVTASDVAEALSATTPPEGIKILPGSGVDINKLAEYDKGIFGARRLLLLASWICISDISLVAFNEKTEIVGYIILRKVESKKTEGASAYRVAPLFADNLFIAQFLLQKSIDSKVVHQSSKLRLHVPREDNPAWMEFLITCNTVPVGEVAHMCTKGICNMLMMLLMTGGKLSIKIRS